MSLGVFTADGAYKISSPDTPTVWGNKLFNDEYVLDVTQRLEGKSFIVKNYVQTGLADFFKAVLSEYKRRLQTAFLRESRGLFGCI